jgi:hypothetical protein
MTVLLVSLKLLSWKKVTLLKRHQCFRDFSWTTFLMFFLIDILFFITCTVIHNLSLELVHNIYTYARNFSIYIYIFYFGSCRFQFSPICYGYGLLQFWSFNICSYFAAISDMFYCNCMIFIVFYCRATMVIHPLHFSVAMLMMKLRN